MLRITKTAAAVEQRWTLCGQLAGPWVSEFAEEWERRRAEAPEQRRVVDLSDVTFVDEAGERLLRDIREQGADFVAAGVDVKDILENLFTRKRGALRGFFGSCADTAPIERDHRTGGGE